MKIVFTGGGTGGHFYPIIAVAEAVREIVRERRLVTPTLYYIAPKAYDPESLFENELIYVQCPIELNPEIGCLDVVIAEERLTRPLIGYLARFKYISSIGYQKGLFYILFHNENGCPFFIDLFYRIEDISHEKRCKSEGRLVKHLEFG